MIKNIGLLVGLCIIFWNTSTAQEVWSLEQCIQHASKNNISLRQAEVDIQQAEWAKKGNEFSRYPNLNAEISGALNFGRTIDPTTNDFRNQRITNSQMSLSSNMILYNGGKISNSIKQSEVDISIAKADAQNIQNDISLQIASAYLNVLLAQEQAAIAQKQVEQTVVQLEQTDKRIDAGVLAQNERLEILAQQARNQQNLIAAQNNAAINLVTLKNLLELDPTFDLTVEVPNEVIPYDPAQEILSLESVYQQALQSQPSIKASEMRIKSANLDIPIAKADKIPRLVLFGSLNSNYAHIESVPNQDGFFNQLDNNLGQSVGAQLSIPIYNRNANNIAIERARLGVVSAEVNYKQAKQQLQADVQNAIANARAARAQLEANEIALDAARASFRNAERTYELGAINTLEFTNAKTNLDTAELDVVRAKYEYVFRMKVIDFYLGKELTLN